MNWSNPLSVTVGDETIKIRNKCDYRVVLDVIEVLTDEELTFFDKIETALYIFYETPPKAENEFEAIKKINEIISCGKPDNGGKAQSRRLMSWKDDFNYIAPAVSRICGYDVRNPKAYTHWYSFVGSYMEIGDCFFASIVAIRKKTANHERLQPHEEAFMKENYSAIFPDSYLGCDDEAYLWEGVSDEWAR